MSQSLPILIVGAGPTGLMMACELARYGVPFRLIDKKPEPAPSSNATWIQPRTLELFQQIGIAERFLSAGHRCDAINFYEKGEPLTTLSLKSIASLFPYILMLPQTTTEKLLTECLSALNGKIERSTELLDIQQDTNSVTATIKNADNSVETLQYDWLVACDGANSIIREKCGLQFPGEDVSDQFVVADADIDFSYLPKDQIHLFFDTGTLLAAFPLGSNKYRIAANLHLNYPRSLYTEREIKEVVQERACGKYYVTNVKWISTFWIHSKLVEKMRHGRIFLAGDAAHIHSPAGGQGMNTGIQDAFNLAWKLALVTHSKVNPNLLDSYHAERHPVAKAVVEQNEYFTKIALFDADFQLKLKQFAEQLSKNEKTLSEKYGAMLSQIDIRYQNSPAMVYHTECSKTSPQTGERAPDVMLDETRRLYDYFRGKKHYILILNSTPDAAYDLQEKIEILSPGLAHVFCVSADSNQPSKHLIFDAHAAIASSYHITTTAIYIIRPDSYICYSANHFDFTPIADLLNKYVR